MISPLELVRTKMQSRRRPYSELLACIRSAVAKDGVLSLWRGWGPTVLRDVPFSGECRFFHSDGEGSVRQRGRNCFLFVFAAFYWFSYEMVKAQLCERARRSQADFSISFTAGAFSGAVSTEPDVQSRFQSWRKIPDLISVSD